MLKTGNSDAFFREKCLTKNNLEELGIIHREQFNEIPPHVEYSLTEKGKALLPVFFEISKWGEENLD